jgi:hypothetical protein
MAIYPVVLLTGERGEVAIIVGPEGDSRDSDGYEEMPSNEEAACNDAYKALMALLPKCGSNLPAAIRRELRGDVADPMTAFLTLMAMSKRPGEPDQFDRLAITYYPMQDAADLIEELQLDRGREAAEAAFAERFDTNAAKEAGKPSGSTERKSKQRRSTAPGEARLKIIGALNAHHLGGDGFNHAPAKVNELARQADVSSGSVSAFFNAKFGGHSEYKALCLRYPSGLKSKLAELDGDLTPHALYNNAGDFRDFARFEDEGEA